MNRIPGFSKNKEIQTYLKILTKGANSEVLETEGPSPKHSFRITATPVFPGHDGCSLVEIKHMISFTEIDELEILPQACKRLYGIPHFPENAPYMCTYVNLESQAFNKMISRFPWFWDMSSSKMDWNWLAGHLKMMAVKVL